MTDVRCVALPAAAEDAFVEPPGADHPVAGLRYAEAPDTIREPRCLVIGDLAGWRIGTAHFSHIGSGERLLQGEATSTAFGDASPALLLGDLNAVIDAAELGAFATWTDAFAEPPGDAARVTTEDGYRIDHLLVRGASVSPARVLRDTGDLSDHYPVVAEIGI